MGKIRIGQGFDVHRLVEGRELVIGGVKIPFEKGLLGHSDADVLLHAIMDALLGAAGLPDIGQHFPPDDGRYKDIDSKVLLGQVYELIKSAGIKRIVNIDSTIVAEKPKLSQFIPEMKSVTASILRMDTADINIKATTTERLGLTGRGEGIAALAVCLLSDE